MKQITIHTDGGCHGNPGPGGWAAVLQWNEHRRELSGGVPVTTNNRMELQAAIEALAVLKQPCEVNLHTDSAYVRNGITKWLITWKRNGWKTRDKQPVKNADLWQQLDALTQAHKVHWHWLKGHAGHCDNERCDELATKAIRRIRKQHDSADLKKMVGQFHSAMARKEAASQAEAFGRNSSPEALAPLKDWLAVQNGSE